MRVLIHGGEWPSRIPNTGSGAMGDLTSATNSWARDGAGRNQEGLSDADGHERAHAHQNTRSPIDACQKKTGGFASNSRLQRAPIDGAIDRRLTGSPNEI